MTPGSPHEQYITAKEFLFHIIQSISKDVSHGKPHVFAFSRMKQKLLSLPLRVVEPVAALAVVHKGTFYVHRRGPLYKFAPLCGAKVPHGLHILVLRQVFG